LQLVPSGAAGSLHSPVAGSQVPATWQASSAVHTTGFAPTHVPPWQVSVRVHGLPSSHAVPSAAAGLSHTPVAGLQVPAAPHVPSATQITGFAPTQTPARQVSVRVQELPSSQLVPFAAAGSLHSPVAGLQVPATWQASSGVHTTGFAPTHAPPWHASVWVHGLPSSQLVPFGAAGSLHSPVAGSHVPAT
jgi:hypothetical protein